jgi:hypothetical protein
MVMARSRRVAPSAVTGWLGLRVVSEEGGGLLRPGCAEASRPTPTSARSTSRAGARKRRSTQPRPGRSFWNAPGLIGSDRLAPGRAGLMHVRGAELQAPPCRNNSGREKLGCSLVRGRRSPPSSRFPLLKLSALFGASWSKPSARGSTRRSASPWVRWNSSSRWRSRRRRAVRPGLPSGSSRSEEKGAVPRRRRTR